MLTIAPLEPLNTTPSTGGAVVLNLVGDGGGMAAIVSRRVDPLSRAINLPIPAYVNGQIQFDLEPDLEIGAVLSLTIGTRLYTLARDPENPQPGELVWSPNAAQGQIRLLLYPNHQPIVGSVAVGAILAPQYPDIAIPTNELTLPVPAFFRRWTVQGQVQLQRSFEEQPSGSLEFLTLASNEAEVRSKLRVYSKLELYGIGFSVASLDIERLPRAVYPEGWINVRVALTGYYEQELRRSILAKGTGCQSTLSELAQRAGVSYVGDPIALNQPRMPSNVTTTLESELRSRVRSVQGFEFYSGKSLEVRSWGQTRIHRLSLADVISPISIQIGGTGEPFRDIRLTQEFRNARFQLDQDQERERQSRNVSIWITDGDEAIASPPYEFTTGQLDLKTGGHCFDNGGETKETTRTLYQNGVIRKVVRTKWGFVYTSDETYRIGGFGSNRRAYYAYFPPQLFWQIVETSTETYLYDKDGYLISVKTTGRKLSRFKQESGSEVIELRLQPSSTANNALITLYKQFRPLPYSDTTTYDLRSMVGLYPDIKRPKDDPDWVAPKFAERTVRRTNEQIFTPNPRSTPQRELPPIVTGKRYREERRININYPSATTTESNWIQEYEQYTLRTITESAEGEGFRNVTRRRHKSENLGRPSTHTREDELAQKTENCPPQPTPPANQLSIRYLLNTPNSLTESDPEEDSISFPGITDPEQGRKCAQTVASIENTKSAEQWTLTLKPARAIELAEGDLVQLAGKTLVIFRIEQTLQIQGAIGRRFVVTTEGVNLTLGRFLQPAVTLTEDES
jgi:hypothetical protein